VGLLLLANDAEFGHTGKPASLQHFDVFPFLVIIVVLVVCAVLAVGLIAARAGIRKRERRRDLVERLIAREILGGDNEFTEDAGIAFVGAVEQFARDLVELGKTLKRREAADVVTARQIRRGA
jgi:hypothetical protein